MLVVLLLLSIGKSSWTLLEYAFVIGQRGNYSFYCYRIHCISSCFSYYGKHVFFTIKWQMQMWKPFAIWTEKYTINIYREYPIGKLFSHLHLPSDGETFFAMIKETASGRIAHTWWMPRDRKVAAAHLCSAHDITIINNSINSILISIILDPNHETIAWNNQKFFTLHLKVSVCCSFKVADLKLFSVPNGTDVRN